MQYMQNLINTNLILLRTFPSFCSLSWIRLYFFFQPPLKKENQRRNYFCGKRFAIRSILHFVQSSVNRFWFILNSYTDLSLQLYYLISKNFDLTKRSMGWNSTFTKCFVSVYLKMQRDALKDKNNNNLLKISLYKLNKTAVILFSF